MTAVSQQRVTPGRRRMHTALGAVAMAATAAATIAVGARTIGIAPPPGDISTFCAAAGQCVQQIPVGPALSSPLLYR